MTDLQNVDEGALIDELRRRGWRYKETLIPYGTYMGSPTRLARQLQHLEPRKPENTDG